MNSENNIKTQTRSSLNNQNINNNQSPLIRGRNTLLNNNNRNHLRHPQSNNSNNYSKYIYPKIKEYFEKNLENRNKNRINASENHLIWRIKKFILKNKTKQYNLNNIFKYCYDCYENKGSISPLSNIKYIKDVTKFDPRYVILIIIYLSMLSSINIKYKNNNNNNIKTLNFQMNYNINLFNYSHTLLDRIDLYYLYYLFNLSQKPVDIQLIKTSLLINSSNNYIKKFKNINLSKNITPNTLNIIKEFDNKNRLFYVNILQGTGDNAGGLKSEYFYLLSKEINILLDYQINHNDEFYKNLFKILELSVINSNPLPYSGPGQHNIDYTIKINKYCKKLVFREMFYEILNDYFFNPKLYKQFNKINLIDRNNNNNNLDELLNHRFSKSYSENIYNFYSTLKAILIDIFDVNRTYFDDKYFAAKTLLELKLNEYNRNQINNINKSINILKNNNNNNVKIRNNLFKIQKEDKLEDFKIPRILFLKEDNEIFKNFKDLFIKLQENLKVNLILDSLKEKHPFIKKLKNKDIGFIYFYIQHYYELLVSIQNRNRFLDNFELKFDYHKKYLINTITNFNYNSKYNLSKK